MSKQGSSGSNAAKMDRMDPCLASRSDTIQTYSNYQTESQLRGSKTFQDTDPKVAISLEGEAVSEFFVTEKRVVSGL